MARPERFELPTYGFVAAGNRTRPAEKSTIYKACGANKSFYLEDYREFLGTSLGTANASANFFIAACACDVSVFI
jgi:hypothetical protein